MIWTKWHAIKLIPGKMFSLYLYRFIDLGTYKYRKEGQKCNMHQFLLETGIIYPLTTSNMIIIFFNFDT